MNTSCIVKNDILKNLGEAAPGLHDKVIELMAKEEKGKLLDIPSGEGRLAYLLKHQGFEVLAGDIDEKVFKIPGIGFQRIDLNARLPFEPECFDYVTCIEGIEHIENSYHLLREFARALKRGGKLVLSTPNILSIHSRLRFLLIGHFAFFGGYYSNEDNLYTYHINPAGFPQIYTALKQAGLRIEEIASNQNVTVGRAWPLRMILRALAVTARITTFLKEKDPYMRKMLCSSEILMGDLIILKCIKS